MVVFGALQVVHTPKRDRGALQMWEPWRAVWHGSLLLFESYVEHLRRRPVVWFADLKLERPACDEDVV
jgi:hypothetical protein